MTGNYQECVRCLMDTSDPGIKFDEAGICSHCKAFDEISLPAWKECQPERLTLMLDSIKTDSIRQRYDCIVGLSGGVDSSYAACMAVEKGLRPLAVHVDGGWNSELAVSNIEKVVTALNIDLVTYVIDWDEMRDLQRAFFLSGEINCDIPQDHAFVAALFDVARRHRIKAFISGYNFATESTTVMGGWGHYYGDLAYLKSIHSAHGRRPLKKYPQMSEQKRTVLSQIFGYRYIDILNYLPYDKSAVKRYLIEEIGWRDYGGKHYESRFTKFFQAYYLPEKYGIDKRRLHLTSLLHAGFITRDEALAEFAAPLYQSAALKEDKDFVLKKLGFGESEWEIIMKTPSPKPGTYRQDRESISWALVSKAQRVRKGLLGKLRG